MSVALAPAVKSMAALSSADQVRAVLFIRWKFCMRLSGEV
jgi:hypothetical protein